jgi:hypothetical protein
MGVFFQQLLYKTPFGISVNLFYVDTHSFPRHFSFEVFVVCVLLNTKRTKHKPFSPDITY